MKSQSHSTVLWCLSGYHGFSFQEKLKRSWDHVLHAQKFKHDLIHIHLIEKSDAGTHKARGIGWHEQEVKIKQHNSNLEYCIVYLKNLHYYMP